MPLQISSRTIMNKNLLFLTLALAVTATEVLPAERKIHKTVAVEQEDEECTICLGVNIDQALLAATEAAQFLTCLHKFHKACLDQWFKTQGENGQTLTCPLCRKPERNQLCLAAHHGDTARVLELLNTQGITVNDTNKYGSTALHYATANNKTATVLALLNRPEINVNAANQLGCTALHYCAARDGNEEIVDALLDRQEINLNIADQWGYTPLHYAVEGNHAAIVGKLILAGVSVIYPLWHITPLHIAASNAESSEVLEALLSTEINIDAEAANAGTALHIATAYGHEENVLILLMHNANTIIKNHNGKTALHIAAESGHKKIVQALLNANANTTLLNRNGQTPAEVASTRAIKQLIMGMQKLQILADHDQFSTV